MKWIKIEDGPGWLNLELALTIRADGSGSRVEMADGDSQLVAGSPEALMGRLEPLNKTSDEATLTVPSILGAAHIIVDAILHDLGDRKGIKHELEAIDADVKAEMFRTLVRLVADILNEYRA